jgi:WD40 repeat protein
VEELQIDAYDFGIRTVILLFFYPGNTWFPNLTHLPGFVQLFVWNPHSVQPVLKYIEHTAAIKAIAWSPHLHGLLASGGGTADRCIRFCHKNSGTSVFLFW